jgi:hypothetical protein
VDPLAGLDTFCQQIRVRTKDLGVVPLWPLFSTQQYLVDEIRAGVERDVHEFIVLKGRQQGATTLCDALSLFYLQTHAGLLGQLVSDDDDNMNFRRLMLRNMLDSLPRAYRFPVSVDNRGQLVFRNASLLLFAAAGKRDTSNNNLGRSKGINYLEADEVGAWQNDRAVSALQASLSERHPLRLYLWPSTAQGFGVFYDMWNAAQSAVTQRAIFIGFWRHALA